MPRLNALPESEVLIGRRLAWVRTSNLASKTAFAANFGISVAMLYNYEKGRAPLPWSLADMVCDRYNISAKWLATGVEPITPYIRPPELHEAGLQGRYMFSVVYQSFFAAYYNPKLTKHGLRSTLETALFPAENKRSKRLESDPDIEAIRRALRLIEAAVCSHLPREEKWAVYDSLSKLAGKIGLNRLLTHKANSAAGKSVPPVS